VITRAGAPANFAAPSRTVGAAKADGRVVVVDRVERPHIVTGSDADDCRDVNLVGTRFPLILDRCLSPALSARCGSEFRAVDAVASVTAFSMYDRLIRHPIRFEAGTRLDGVIHRAYAEIMPAFAAMEVKCFTTIGRECARLVRAARCTLSAVVVCRHLRQTVFRSRAGKPAADIGAREKEPLRPFSSHRQ